jgi:multiple sugar transport system substrate-binding protein
MRTQTLARAGIAIAGIVAASLALAGCSSSGSSGSSSGEKVTLTFQSLAYQDTTVAATKSIVDSWNKANPNIQVKLQQGSWDNVHDQLVTQFQGGTAPDIIHDESADIMGFANQGYLADLGKYLSDDVKKQVSKDVWSSVTTADGKIVAAPTLLQSYVVFANKSAFKAAGVDVPSGDTLSWNDFQSLSKKLTASGKFGTGWGMKQPTATVMNLALGFAGTFFDNKDGKSTIHVGDDELQVPKRINQMAYSDKSLDPVSLTQSGTDVLPGFFGGKYAMYVGGNYVAQQISESAPAGFDWAVLPPLAGSGSAAQAANPQTMSVSAQSKHIEQSAKFIDYFMNAENQAKLAEGDWLIPASAAARAQVSKDTAGKNGWNTILKSGDELKAAPFQAATSYPQWKDQYATPALQKYLANSISLDDLKKQLTDGWNALG